LGEILPSPAFLAKDHMGLLKRHFLKAEDIPGFGLGYAGKIYGNDGRDFGVSSGCLLSEEHDGVPVGGYLNASGNVRLTNDALRESSIDMKRRTLKTEAAPVRSLGDTEGGLVEEAMCLRGEVVVLWARDTTENIRFAVNGDKGAGKSSPR
jgi:hypothetical protein